MIKDANDMKNSRMVSNITMFYDRVGNHSDRFENLLFLNSLLIKQMMKLEEGLSNYNFTSGDELNDNELTNKIKSFYNQHKINISDYIVRDRNHFSPSDLHFTRERIDQLIHIVDCISCEKSQLNTQLHVRGLSTLLKISGEKTVNLKNYTRNEIIVILLLILLKELNSSLL